MGSWNKTCGLSNLHIFAGTPVYVFVLEDVSAERDNSCYTTSLFSPLLLPFNSEYNDYGGGQNSGGPAFERIMNAIKESLIEVDVGDNEYHDIAVKRDAFNEELFFDAVHENRLKIKGWRGKPVNLSFTMFRRDVVDDILENRVIEHYVGSGKGTGGYGNNYVYYKFQDIVADIRPMLDEIVKYLTEYRADGVSDHLTFKLVGGLEYMFDHDHPNRAVQWLRPDTYRYSRLVDSRQFIQEVFKDHSEEKLQQLEALYTELLKGVFIEEFMSTARKTWIPGGHEGSQSESADALRLLYNATFKAVDREREEYDLDEDEVQRCPKCNEEWSGTSCGINDCGWIAGVEE